MRSISAPHHLTDSDLFIDLAPVLGHALHMKCEGLNFGGSIKLRAAASMIAAAERDHLLREDSVLVESSSGNLGVALSIIAANKGLSFTCVTDVRCNEVTAATMRALGTELLVVEKPDPEGGFLKARLDRVRALCAEDDRNIWLNQYSNPANWGAHYEGTAPSILKYLPDVDVLFVGVGTGGTAMGCARYFRDSGSHARLVAVDTVGSVTFGRPPEPRLIPGLGASVMPPLFEPEAFDDLVQVSELDTVRLCRTLARRGMLFGGSTGTVVAGALQWLERFDPERKQRSVCIAPDMGDRYLTTLYNDRWVLENFGPEGLRPLHPLEPAQLLWHASPMPQPVG
ncbi:2,3-diaminopropionate biosynthesis protein SbnA [Streptomyces sp. NPDC059496]|uniref:2,3-diaminopropionate biosynthesis protein SbnA n=1 Tax=Streptomyces sp. NPDC059496 TaxID=3346851 RepID=UPI0036AB4927